MLIQWSLGKPDPTLIRTIFGQIKASISHRNYYYYYYFSTLLLFLLLLLLLLLFTLRYIVSALKCFTLALRDGFLCYVCHRVSIRWSGLPGNPDQLFLHVVRTTKGL